jgi:hypothetical protein
MPYVKQDRRDVLRPSADVFPKVAGELNYQFTELALNYVLAHGLSYKTINDIVGALEGAKLEFYRRVAAPYEDTKIKENGDVYPG